MTKTDEISCQRVLAPTGMAQADYVINPYRGCQFGCRYCYAQWNKFARKQNCEWGSFVHIKTNAPQVLAGELKAGVSGTVMLGSTTEVYQPAERKYRITRQILEQLADTSLSVIILTRSDLICRDIDILRKLKRVLICFTINSLDEGVVRSFEKCASPVANRLDAVRLLRSAGLDVYLHAGPYLPVLTEPEKILDKVEGLVDRVDFENLNLKMLSWERLKHILVSDFPHLVSQYEEIYLNKDGFQAYWDNVRERLTSLSAQYPVAVNIYFHPYDSFFPVYTS
jgi:DNA repair photolyase